MTEVTNAPSEEFCNSILLSNEESGNFLMPNNQEKECVSAAIAECQEENENCLNETHSDCNLRLCNVGPVTKHSSEIQETCLKQERLDGNCYICPYCQKQFDDDKTFDKHKEIHMGGWPFTCQVCHKGFLLLHLLESHASYHKNEIFSCDNCDKKCLSRYKLKLHMKMHVDQFNCRACKLTFPTIESLKTHKRHHKKNIKKDMLSCKICSAKFSVHIELKVHLRKHGTDWPFSCDVCKKMYRRKGSFITHLSKCLGVSPYSCDICSSTFIRQRQFIQHVKEVHNGLRPFKCESCGKRFNSKSNLEIHSQVHSARLPTIYKCSLCQQMFNSARKLRGHKIREHSLYRPFKCNTCKKIFLFKSQLSNHSKEHRIKEL